MKVYMVAGFTGHWPVGTSAVIVATDRLDALGLLNQELKRAGLPVIDPREVGSQMFVQLDVNDRHAVILQDGNY